MGVNYTFKKRNVFFYSIRSTPSIPSLETDYMLFLQHNTTVRPTGKLILSAVAEEQIHFLANLRVSFYTLNICFVFFFL